MSLSEQSHKESLWIAICPTWLRGLLRGPLQQDRNECLLRPRKSPLARSAPNRDCLARLQSDRGFRLVGKELVNSFACAGTGREAVVIEDHHTTSIETRAGFQRHQSDEDSSATHGEAVGLGHISNCSNGLGAIDDARAPAFKCPGLIVRAAEGLLAEAFAENGYSIIEIPKSLGVRG